MLTPTPKPLDHYIATWRASVLTERAALSSDLFRAMRQGGWFGLEPIGLVQWRAVR